MKTASTYGASTSQALNTSVTREGSPGDAAIASMFPQRPRNTGNMGVNGFTHIGDRPATRIWSSATRSRIPRNTRCTIPSFAYANEIQVDPYKQKTSSTISSSPEITKLTCVGQRGASRSRQAPQTLQLQRPQ